MFLASIFGLQDVTPQTWLPTSDCSATASSLLRSRAQRQHCGGGRQLYHAWTRRLTQRGWRPFWAAPCLALPALERCANILRPWADETGNQARPFIKGVQNAASSRPTTRWWCSGRRIIRTGSSRRRLRGLVDSAALSNTSTAHTIRTALRTALLLIQPM